MLRIRELAKQHFKNKEYVQSVNLYTRAIQLQPDSALLYQNRAIARAKLDKHSEVVEDATIALVLDPGRDKAMFQRALAKEKLGAYKASG